MTSWQSGHAVSVGLSLEQLRLSHIHNCSSWHKKFISSLKMWCDLQRITVSKPQQEIRYWVCKLTSIRFRNLIRPLNRDQTYSFPLSNRDVIVVAMIWPTLDLQVDRLPHGAPVLHTPGWQDVNDLDSVVRKVQKHPVMLLAELEIPKTHEIKMEQNWFRSPFVNNWSNPIMTDIQVPKVKISQLPVFLNLCEVVVS